MSENNRNLNKEYTPSSSENAGAEPASVAAQLQKIQTHLGFLEKKLDLLLAQQPQPRSGGFGGPRPSGGGRGEFRPRRPFRSGGGDFRGRSGGDRPDRGGEGRPPMREGRPPMREGRGGEDRPREFRGGHGGGFKKRPRNF